MKPRKTNSIISENFIKNLSEVIAGYLSHEDFEKLIEIIKTTIKENSFDQSAEANLLRIIQSSHDKAHFLRDIIEYELNRDAIIIISQNSNYFTDILVRNPEYFYYAITPHDVLYKTGNSYYETSIKSSLSKFKSFESKVRILKSIKRKEILQIGLQDILFNAPLDVTTKHLSLLAKQICSSLFELCLQNIREKHSIQKLIEDYCIIALGKLGGDELNYSSDIDLIIFYNEDEQLKKTKSKKEILTEAVVLFIQTATQINEDGFLYRIDFRLRPDGRNASLCRGLTDYLNYYESRGEDWERQMLLKSSFVCGQIILFNKFINFLRPFIYPASFAASPTKQISKLKNNIENKISDEQNIKLSPGGIRDIEFSVQALQLINGGKISELRHQNTLTAITKLNENNLLSDAEASSMTDNYILYRRIEHFLQLMNNRQTHTIPIDPLFRSKLSLFLGYKNSLELDQDLQIRSERIIAIRNSILGMEVDLKNSSDLFDDIQFENTKQAKTNIRFLREGMGVSGRRIFERNSIEAFSKIENELFLRLKSCVEPDLALDNFVKIINHTDFPSLWYNQLRDKKLLEAFLILCQFNQHAVDLLLNDETNKELFLSGHFSENIFQSDLSSFSLQNILLIISSQFTLGLISPREVSATIKKYLKNIILKLVEEKLDKISKLNYFISSLGSFSTGEMTLTSDVDLLFIVKDLQKQKSAQKHFQIFLLELKEKLKPFNVDCRLRPEGKSSYLVWDLESSIVYLQSRARIWELQAFTKINFVAGNDKLYNKFYQKINDRIKKERSEQIRDEMLSMHNKIISLSGSEFSKIDFKKGKGGLIDIEFILQYLILCNPKYFILNSGKDLFENITSLQDIFPVNNFKTSLKSNYLFLKNLQLSIQTLFNFLTPKIPTGKKQLKILEGFFNLHNEGNYKATLSRVMKENHQLFNFIFRGKN